ncbi:phosphosulfolactate synthase [Marinicrinis lubricantis]|uniref:Phosphosulfolactate synthase n=1 Tax=Marinicrinis lubricantis TaxID=2086470 RepID=A0ABW1IRM5_9BACL
MEIISELGWNPRLVDPTKNRNKKPRTTTGITMVLDKGLGITALEDFLQTASEHVDIIKLGFGTSALYPKEVLKQKIELIKKYQVLVMPGGTFLEVAIVQGALKDFFHSVIDFGFDAIEVSDGTIEMSRLLRNEIIQTSFDLGLEVFTEYGKKLLGSKVDAEELLSTLTFDLEHGARMVTVEGRESGVGVGLFDEKGELEAEQFSEIMKHLPAPDKLLWEAPLKSQQLFLLQHFGQNVNLGNISPQDVMSLEALRRGLRSDTMTL